jgi:hypothetical protein
MLGPGCQDQGGEPKQPQPGFGGSEIPEVGVDSPTNRVHIAYQCAPNTCSQVRLIQVMHLVKKGSPDLLADPPSQGLDAGGVGFNSYTPPDDKDAKGGHVVDKNIANTPGYDPNTPGSGDNSPYYLGSKPGDATNPASLDDQPANAKPGYKQIFEVCAYCSMKNGDAMFGRYLDCITWEMDRDTMKASRTTPQPAKKPTPEFEGAVATWDSNHKFTLPK